VALVLRENKKIKCQNGIKKLSVLQNELNFRLVCFLYMIIHMRPENIVIDKFYSLSSPPLL